MASTKRVISEVAEPLDSVKKAKLLESDVSNSQTLTGLLTRQPVVLNTADCNLDFNVDGNGLQGSGLHENGFAYCWSGARANVGITGGKYCFGCKIISSQPVHMEDTPIDQQHVCRIGISRGDDDVGYLGESSHSFGYGGTGKYSTARTFFDYGEKFGVGDTIVCAVDLEHKPLASIGFSKNGQWLGVRQFNAGPNGLGVLDSPIKNIQRESAVFPHVLLKNVVVQLQFSTDDGLVPVEGYGPWSSALEEGKSLMGPSCSEHQDSEVIMLVGLPASGKSTWAEKWMKDHPEKRYVLLGTNLALDQMKVPGLHRKNNYGERFERLMNRATEIFNTLLTRACRIRRNYILDQTNVYRNARKRKLKPFANFRKIAVVVFPKPDELRIRSEKRFKDMGKQVPAEAVNEMLANYVLPTSKDMPGTDEYFDEVIFPELDRMEAQRSLYDMRASLNTKSDFSPYANNGSDRSCSNTLGQNSQESPIEPYKSTSLELQYQGSLPGASTQLQNAYPPQPSISDPYRNYSRPGDISLQVSYGRPVAMPSYENSPLQGSYGSPVARPSYGNSPLQSSYGSLIERPGYGNPPLQSSYGSPMAMPSYGNSPLQISYGSPVARPSYGNSPLQSSYGSLIERPGYGNPRLQSSYGSPMAMPSYGNSPLQSSYESSMTRPSYGNPPPMQHSSGGLVPPMQQYRGYAPPVPYSGGHHPPQHLGGNAPPPPG